MTRDELLEALSRLRMAPASNGGRHPHKPLLVLWLLGRAQVGDFGPFNYDDVEDPVDELLAEFGTPARTDRGRTAMPFFHLEDELWEKRPTVPGEQLGDGRGRFRKAQAIGSLRGEVQALLSADRALIADAAVMLLEQHFTDSHVEPILGAVGIELDGYSGPARSVDVVATRRRRDPAFREATLRAYAYCCAMCGWDGALRKQPVGLEAAHLRWHSQGGDDTADNGLALCSLHHKLLDLGVLGLSPDLHIEVAERFVATSAVGHQLGHELHQRPLNVPQPGHPRLAESNIEWHRSEVFHGAA